MASRTITMYAEKQFELEEMKDAMQQFLIALKETETYRNYERYKELLIMNPDLKKRVDAYREKNFVFQQQCNEDVIFEEVDHLVNEMEELRRDPLVHEFLKDELAYCKMVQNIRDYFLNAISVDFD